jgi:endonuclease/exonuclease/phosphatase family metal-dependent hydrolase
MTILQVGTYNVHGHKGIDGKIRADRTFDVVRHLHADCVALQEFVNAPAQAGEPLIEHWARVLEMHAAYAPAFQRGGEEFGNALLSRWPIVEQHAHDVTLRGYRRRVVLEALVSVEGVLVQIMSLHLGVSPRERALQAERMFELCSATRADVHVVLGDFNEWSRFSAMSRRLRKHFDASRQLATFPSWAPVVGLDRVWVYPRGLVRETRVDTSAAARRASDHLPLVATIALGPTRHAAEP